MSEATAVMVGIDLLDDYLLLTQSYHDTKSISPFHVTVIMAVAALIGVDPKKNSLELSSAVSIAALDNLCENAGDEISTMTFEYNRLDHELLVIARSDGLIRLYCHEDAVDRYEECCDSGNWTAE